MDLKTLVEQHGAERVAVVLGMTERYVKRCLKSGRGIRTVKLVNAEKKLNNN
jgi:hypothetical protein